VNELSIIPCPSEPELPVLIGTAGERSAGSELENTVRLGAEQETRPNEAVGLFHPNSG